MSSQRSTCRQVLSSLTREISPMSDAPMNPFLVLVGKRKVSVPSEPVKIMRPGHSTHLWVKPIAETAGLMEMSIPCGNGARKSQLLPEQKKSPLGLVVVKLNSTPPRVIVKLVAPLAALLGSNGSSIA